jgi:hypothetical protein
MEIGDSGKKLSDVIKKAISDCEISTAEYNKILRMADEDATIDHQEQQLLSQLHQMVANGTIKRVAE